MAAVGNYEILSGTYGPYTDATVYTIEVVVPFGKRVLSGGLDQDLTSPAMQAVFTASYPSNDGTKWIFKVRGQGSTSQPAQGVYRVVVAEMG